jgi:hypothetical protein
MIDLVRPRRNMIVLEGPDGGGKSTLLQKLYENTGYKIASKAVTSEGTGVTNIKSYVRGHITQGFQQRLFDRFALISGPIYGSVNFMAPPNDCFQDRVWHMTMEAAFLGAASSDDLLPATTGCRQGEPQERRRVGSSRGEQHRDDLLPVPGTSRAGLCHRHRRRLRLHDGWRLPNRSGSHPPPRQRRADL